MDKLSKREEHVISGLQRWFLKCTSNKVCFTWNWLNVITSSSTLKVTNSARVLQWEKGILIQFSASNHGSANSVDLHSAPPTLQVCLYFILDFFVLFRSSHYFYFFSTNIWVFWASAQIWSISGISLFCCRIWCSSQEPNRWGIFEAKLLKRINNELHFSWPRKQMFTNAPYISEWVIFELFFM